MIYLLFLLAPLLFAQPQAHIFVSANPTGACSPRSTPRITLSTGAVSTCANGTWTTIAAGVVGTVTNVSGTSPISVATGTTTPVVSLNDTVVTPASYTNPNITIDAKGRITAAANGTAGASPSGSSGYLQLYGTSTTFTSDSRYVVDTSSNGEMRAGTSLRFLGYGAMVSATDDISLYVGATDDSQYRLVDINIFVPPGGSTEKAATGVIIRAQADSGTKYFDTQVTFGVAEAVNGSGVAPYAFGAEGHCTTATNCATLTDYNLFLANSITGETLLQNTSAAPHQLSVPATTTFATLGPSLATGGFFYTTNGTTTNCADSAGAAACGSAAAGRFVADAAATSVVVSTTAVTANSEIFVEYDSSLSTALSVTCNATIPSAYAVTARTAGASFTLTTTANVANPGCFSYHVVN